MLRILTPETMSPLTDDWLLPPALLLGMRNGEDVRLHGRISPSLLDALDRIQAMLIDHADPRCALYPIAVTASETATVSPPPPGLTISAFSGGLDSFYTALELEDELDGHLYVHGYETVQEDQSQLFLLLPHLKAAAGALGRPLYLVDSDHWELLWRGGGRTVTAAAALLAMVGFLMSSHVRRLVLPGSYGREHEESRWSSLTHFIPLWSTPQLDVEQHGTVSRTMKAERLTHSTAAMRHLRVCWGRWGKAYNCGRCWKCVRTMMNFELAGAAGRCSTLPATLDLEHVSPLRPDAQGRAILAQELLDEAEALGREDLASVLRARITRAVPAESASWLRPWHRLVRTLGNAPLRRHRARTRRALRRHLRQSGDQHLFLTVGGDDGEAANGDGGMA